MTKEETKTKTKKETYHVSKQVIEDMCNTLSILTQSTITLKNSLNFIIERIFKTGQVHTGDYEIFGELMKGKNLDEIKDEINKRNQGKRIM